MNHPDIMSGTLAAALPFVMVAVGTVVVIWIANRFVAERFEAFSRSRLARQLAAIAIGGIGLVLAILALPTGSETHGQLLGLLGLLVTAVVALSSGTLAANAMAGMMLRTMRSFHAGDFIRCAEHFGRVTEISLFHTEIQTTNRDLTTLPNAFLIANPVTVVRHSGTFVRSSVSLGYDVPHDKAEKLLLKAAANAGLGEPFVLIDELGNFAVSYTVAGFLGDTRHLVSAETNLRRAMLDTLHDGGIEIASPALMTQRRLRDGEKIVSVGESAPPRPAHEHVPESVVFDKAEQAARNEALQRQREELAQQLEALRGELNSADEAAQSTIEAQIDVLGKQIRHIDDSLVQSRQRPSD